MLNKILGMQNYLKEIKGKAKCSKKSSKTFANGFSIFAKTVFRNKIVLPSRPLLKKEQG